MRRLLIVWLLLGFLAVIISCSPKEQGEEAQMPKWEDYQDKLQRTLFELAIADDPQAYAKQHGVEGFPLVRVVIELEPGASLPEGFTLQVESRFDDQVQVLMPLKELLDLSQQPQVRYIRAPVKPRKPYRQ